ncbi:MFS transporter [Kiloniella antarctica]|uniref:MFS transporter n=1 Tax=Kiloniella antarctica TaxID=1550907 RepID=A0ABW5BQX6_9PROT
MIRKIDYALVGPGLCITATSYGLCRYAYGLFIPIFREEFNLSDEALAYIASISYASYFLVALLGIYISSKIDPRKSLLLGGMTAVVGMMLIATALSPAMLVLGVALAGVTPGLAYTPVSELVVTFVSPNRQRSIYAIINSGTSLGVLLSGPVAILFEGAWRWSWVGFSGFALLATLWCAWVIPKVPKDRKAKKNSTVSITISTFLHPERLRLLIIAFVIGIATSVYWTFSVDLISTSEGKSGEIFGYVFNSELVAQLFWIVVGIAGFGGMFAGYVVNKMGIVLAMALFQIGITTATALLASTDHIAAIILSAVLFGAFFVFVAAALGMWSLSLFNDVPAVGFGFTFLMLSVGQFIGPVLTANLVGSIGLQGVFFLSAVVAGSIVFLLPLRREFKFLEKI